MDAAFQAYRRSNNTSLTRIDMLIGLYRKTLDTLTTGVEAMQTQNEELLVSSQITAYQCVLALVEGIDPDQGEVSQNTQRLWMYVAGLLQQNTVENWETAIRILEPLNESFVAIRDEAISLEVCGDIPALNFDSSHEHAVL